MWQLKANALTDWLNTLLIVISAFLAFTLPYPVFLVAYACLGPLHYLTEINWAQKKSFFLPWKGWILAAIALSILIILPKILIAIPPGDVTFTSPLISFVRQYSNSFLLTAFLLAMGLQLRLSGYKLLLLVFGSFCISLALSQVPLYILIFGVLLPTLIHVYLFTLIFMLSGALRLPTTPGLVNVAAMLFIPLIIIALPVNPSSYLMPESMKSIFLENEFHRLIVALKGLLGLDNAQSFFFYEHAEWKLQIFIAFAYTYHYLNWFSKTTVIKWHNALTPSRTIGIAVLWIISVSLFWNDYRTGFLALLGLSILHVIVEFPINIQSVQSIFRMLTGKSNS